jgi:hypothetical protein
MAGAGRMAFGIAGRKFYCPLPRLASEGRSTTLSRTSESWLAETIQASEVSEVYLPFVCFAEPPTTISRAGGTTGARPPARS